MISIIIPARNDKLYLERVLQAVAMQTLPPNEIIVVDSSESPIVLGEEIYDCLSDGEIQLKIIHCPVRMYPGAARNLGISLSKGKYIALLDTKTMPGPEWLLYMSFLIKNEKVQVALGNTIYEVHTEFEKIFAISTYGFNPIVTLPGSILERSVFNRVGLFVDWVMAGEDSDWMLRLKTHRVIYSHSTSKESLKYVGLGGVSFAGVLRKWYRNYYACRDLPHLANHQLMYLLFFTTIFILIAYTWNGHFANWNDQNFLYLPNITKISFFVMLGVYFLYRSAIRPISLGASIKWLFPYRFLLVLAISVLLDFVKFIAFIKVSDRLKRIFS